MKGFEYAGFSSDELGIKVTKVKKDIVGELSANTVKLSGRVGEVYKGSEIGSKKIDIECFSDTVATQREKELQLRDIAGFIAQTTDGDLYPLILEHEQDITYWVYPTAISEYAPASEGNPEGSFTLTFTCPEAKGYKEEIETGLTRATNTLQAEGTAPTAPIFNLQVGADTKKIGISDTDGNYIYIGSGFNVDDADTSVNMKPRVLYDPCNTLATWTKVTSAGLTFNLENGKIVSDADITSSTNSLEPSKKGGNYFFGTQPEGWKGWYGAARKQMLNTACTDYTIRARFYVNNIYGRAKNKIELYLLDAQGTRIGKLMIKDNGNSMENMVHIQIGSDTGTGSSKGIYNSDTDKKVKTTKKNTLTKKPVVYKQKKKVTKKKKGKKKTETVSKTYSYKQSSEENTFTDFYGYLELKKVGNKYTATVQKLDKNGKEIKNGKFTSKTYTDSSNKFSKRPLAGIAVYMAKMAIDEDKINESYKPNTIKLADVRVWNILEKAPTSVVAEKGDEIIIDCDNKVVYKNGVVYLEDLYIGSKFLALDPQEELTYSVSPRPSANAEWTVSYHPKYY